MLVRFCPYTLTFKGAKIKSIIIYSNAKVTQEKVQWNKELSDVIHIGVGCWKDVTAESEKTPSEMSVNCTEKL